MRPWRARNKFLFLICSLVVALRVDVVKEKSDQAIDKQQ